MLVNILGSEIEKKVIKSEEGYFFTVTLLAENDTDGTYLNYKIVITHSVGDSLKLVSFMETPLIDEARAKYNKAIEIAKKIA